MNDIYVSIIVDVSVDSLNKPFVFKLPDDLRDSIKPGDKVIVPFGKGNKETEAFVVELLDLEKLKEKPYYKKDAYFKKDDAIANLKYVKSKADKKIAANDILFKMAIFLCKEYVCPLSKCFNTVLPVKKEIRKNKRQRDVVENYKVDEIEKKEKNEIELNNEQQKIVDDILNSRDNFKKAKDKTLDEHLIYGITGSGKTEVYIRIIEEVLNEGKKVIVLIPEIALTHQTVIRLKQKFTDNIAIIHSRMSEGERYIQYKKCEEGKTDILVGPRSAIFAPFTDLGLVVIDEVNDSSYKSETNPRYETIDVARFRCREQNAMLITLSATPNINLFYEAGNDSKILDHRIRLHKLSKRASSTLPTVTLVDMKKEVKSGNKSIFSKFLQEKIKEKLERHEQIMLYMNRRGYDTIFTCKDCGETYKCPHCDVALVSHSDGKLKCHYCGYEVDEPMACPTCHSRDIEKYGMGTEKLEEICIDLFPNAKILRMDRDTTKEKDGHDKIIEKFKNHEADILIGTQMIVKGHDFPNVTLVAVMRADLSLYAQDYKAAENTFSMLTQCVGRSGRKVSGESIIQAFDIENDVMKLAAKQDYEKFYKEEITYREKLNYPPFSKLLVIRLSSEDVYSLDIAGKNIKLYLETKNDREAVILGPTVANPEKIKDVHYKIIYVKCKTIDDAKWFRALAEHYKKFMDKHGVITSNYDIE